MADRLDAVKRRRAADGISNQDIIWMLSEIVRLRKVEVQYELIPGYLRYTGPDLTPNPRPVDRELTRAQEAGYEPF